MQVAAKRMPNQDRVSGSTDAVHLIRDRRGKRWSTELALVDSEMRLTCSAALDEVDQRGSYSSLEDAGAGQSSLGSFDCTRP